MRRDLHGAPPSLTAERAARRGRRAGAAVLVAVAGAVVLYLLFWPLPVDPVSWEPPSAPELVGELAPNRALAAVERLELDGARGPEDVALDGRGLLYTGVEDGRILRIDPAGGAPETFARTGGRPNGLAFDEEGTLWVADMERGLLSVSPGGEVRVRVEEVEGRPLGRANGLDVAPDGTVYFTDASHRFPDGPPLLDFVDGRPAGRLLAYDPASGEAAVVLDSLHFANGVSVEPGGGHLLVAETSRYRIRRVSLGGEDRGEEVADGGDAVRAETFAGNLPGFPDGVRHDDRGVIWVALVAPRNAVLDWLGPRPFLRSVILRLPGWIRPDPPRYGFVLGLDAEGRVVHNLQDPGGGFAAVTNVRPADGLLYLGSLEEDAVGRLRLER